MRLKDKIAIITGAGGGLGTATAKLFSSEGASLVLTDISRDALDEVLKQVPNAIGICHDVSDEAAWLEVMQAAEATYGKLDILINNAGIYTVAPLEEISVELYNKTVSINQTGSFLGIKHAIRLMGDGASIVNISSFNGVRGGAYHAAYCATKFAVCGMTKAAALELAGRNIRVNSVHPGAIKTNMLPQGVEPEGLIPMGRFAEPEEIAPLILFLASDESSYCTGSEFVADGGLSC
jgi:3alpha(or 20beta)-hydroxysteroid dehydrogenase